MAWTPGDTSYRSMRRLFNMRQKQAEQKGCHWTLTLEQFHQLTSQNCHYCDKPPLQKTRNYYYNGLDRIHPGGPYSLENCITACWPCNLLRSNLLTVEETEVVIAALLDFRKKKG